MHVFEMHLRRAMHLKYNQWINQCSSGIKILSKNSKNTMKEQIPLKIVTFHFSGAYKLFLCNKLCLIIICQRLHID